MMLHNHLELTQGKEGHTKTGHLSVNDRRETECTGRKVTGKHDELQEIAYETFGLASALRGGETAVVCWLQTKSVVRWEFGSTRG